ncbi:polyprenyl synthetase family protein, partial [Lysobacter sp. 2RAB21]
RLDVAALERLHSLKTGALIRASVRLGALCGGADTAALEALDRYARALGLAFQVRDDILDIEGDSQTLGKTAGKDIAQDKSTFPALIGVEASRARLDELAQVMRDALEPFGERANALQALGRLAIERDR